MTTGRRRTWLSVKVRLSSSRRIDKKCTLPLVAGFLGGTEVTVGLEAGSGMRILELGEEPPLSIDDRVLTGLLRFPGWLLSAGMRLSLYTFGWMRRLAIVELNISQHRFTALRAGLWLSSPRECAAHRQVFPFRNNITDLVGSVLIVGGLVGLTIAVLLSRYSNLVNWKAMSVLAVFLDERCTRLQGDEEKQHFQYVGGEGRPGNLESYMKSRTCSG